MSKLRLFILAMAASAFLASCGGGSGADPATLTQSNVKDLAVAGTEGVKGASSAKETPLSFKSGETANNSAVENLTKLVIQNRYATQDLSYLCNSGSITIESDDNISGVVTFSNCIIYDGYSNIILNGTMTITASNSGSRFTANLSVEQNSLTTSISMTGTCDNQYNCTFTTSFAGIDGRFYTTANMSVSGNNISGYSVSGRVTDPTHGFITISTDIPVTFNCPDGRPDNGQITITGNGSATVTYDNCTSFIVTYNGNGTVYNWADI